MTETTAGFPLGIYLTCALGIVISVVLPILRAMLPKPLESRGTARGIWEIAWPYLVLGVFSLVGAVLIVAAAGDTLKDWRAAVLAGYAWDSTLQKLKPVPQLT
jgi:hypothetical protein